ncbi:CRISPR-associated endonuclease Cas2 [Allisonella histaminiformans]|uniref:CRISPR-associated endonuclease Cas2 n=1 Tax=Allisonella histaminiformans TaxID=209880 RepID=UPI0022E0B144|nr:CRISPR-associated endonuclease Cas2 [Allisonella histaminiformans]
MRVLVFFDLPTGTKQEKKQYIRFRKYLLDNGYEMLQYSVYCRITGNRDEAEKYIAHLQMNLPRDGQVRSLLITELQYEQMKILLGSPTISEKKVKDRELLVL